MRIRQQDYLKRGNQSLVLDLILHQGPISRAAIARKLQMSSTSASRIVQSLLDLSLIQIVDNEEIPVDEVGRKATYFVVNANAVITVGIELTFDNIRIGLMNLKGQFMTVESLKQATDNPQTVVNRIVEHLQMLQTKHHVTNEAIYGLALGLPGVVDNEEGIVHLSGQLDWQEVPLKQMLKEQLPYHIRVDNELKLKALAEVLTASERYENVVTIGMGKGIGSALIRNGEIYRGKNNYAGEIGHMTVNPFGPLCSCGQQGCLNSYVSIDYIVREARAVSRVGNFRQIVEAYEQKEMWAVHLLEKVATYASVAINHVIHVYNPDAIYLSGQLIEEFPLMQGLIKERQQIQRIKLPIVQPEIFITQLHENDVITGAGLGMFQQLLKKMDV